MEKVKELSPRQIKMTRGLAITSMIVLHLFCRKGSDVYGTPLLWTNSQTPLVYWLGFLSEICVGMYCLCSGYAHYRLGETNGLTPKRNGKRLLKFIINFWIVCTLFSFIGLFVNGGKEIPGGMITFLENLTMLNFSYNGAWWFALTYVYLVIFSRLICKAIKNCNSIVTVILLFAQYGAREIIMHLWTIPAGSGRLVSYPLTQLQNFFLSGASYIRYRYALSKEKRYLKAQQLLARQAAESSQLPFIYVNCFRLCRCLRS